MVGPLTVCPVYNRLESYHEIGRGLCKRGKVTKDSTTKSDTNTPTIKSDTNTPTTKSDTNTPTTKSSDDTSIPAPTILPFNFAIFRTTRMILRQ